MTGCTKVSPGCAHCYAETIILRFKRGGTFLPGMATIHPHHERLDVPRGWRKPRRMFVNSISDLFHEEVPFEFVREVFHRMESYDKHNHQVITNRIRYSITSDPATPDVGSSTPTTNPTTIPTGVE